MLLNEHTGKGLYLNVYHVFYDLNVCARSVGIPSDFAVSIQRASCANIP